VEPPARLWQSEQTLHALWPTKIDTHVQPIYNEEAHLYSKRASLLFLLRCLVTKRKTLSENNGRYSSHSGFELEVGELLSPELLVAAPATGRQAQGCVAGGHILAPGTVVSGTLIGDFATESNSFTLLSSYHCRIPAKLIHDGPSCLLPTTSNSLRQRSRGS